MFILKGLIDALLFAFVWRVPAKRVGQNSTRARPNLWTARQEMRGSSLRLGSSGVGSREALRAPLQVSYSLPVARWVGRAGRADPPTGKLEQDLQGHLDLAGSADGFGYVAEAERGVVQRLALGREAVEVFVLGHVVDGYVEARRVREVEDVEADAGAEALADPGVFDDGEVGALLPALAEDVALAGSGIGFEGVTRRNRAVQIAGGEQRHREAVGLQRWAVDTVGTGQRGLWRAAVP